MEIAPSDNLYHTLQDTCQAAQRLQNTIIMYSDETFNKNPNKSKKV